MSAAWLARVLVELGRNDEALELTRESEELAGEDDITAQVPWRRARAKVLARRGASEEAERIARQSVAIELQARCSAWSRSADSIPPFAFATCGFAPEDNTG